ncbi:MAG: metal-dependent phosphohydrolase [Planctomycetales bacterium]|nr:metal-dependent phosphohydrolase [Planctomycetales bacterium]
MQRLKRIGQLGLVQRVYPGANHSRFEHSLGAYRVACEALNCLLRDPSAAETIDEEDAKVFLLGTLLHDVGHWPYCHPIEDMRLPGLQPHELVAASHICSPGIAGLIERDWDVPPQDVADFVASRSSNPRRRLLESLLNGPVDVDKMDYLNRDSLHAGVPYGRNFDLARLLGSLCAGPDKQCIAITEKGKTAAEMLVFARYVMFSEVYWHHAVRSATAMLQRLVYELADHLDFDKCCHMTDQEFESQLLGHSQKIAQLTALGEGIFGTRRHLYKQAGQYKCIEHPDIHQAFARRSFAELVECSCRVAEELSSCLPTPILPHEVIIDAPPIKLEVQFALSVRISNLSRISSFCQLSELSPVVRALATEQFDSFVKQVRLFVAPDRVQEIRELPPDLIKSALIQSSLS